MGIRDLVERLASRLPGQPQYATQGATLFVDLERRTTLRRYLPVAVLENFLGGRGANMFLLYNLLQEDRDALDPAVPLIYGNGTLTSHMPSATRGNFTSRSPDSYAILDSSGGDYFPAFTKRHGYDHFVFYGCSPQWTILKISLQTIEFIDATPYLGRDNIDFTAAIERDFQCTERKDMAMARITAAGENQVLCSGIMGGPKAIWSRGGGGAKMGALRLKAILVLGRIAATEAPSSEYRANNRMIGRKITGASVIRNALKMVGTPFLYKPCRTLGALGTRNNQETSWVSTLDADNFDAYRPGMDGCFKCPVQCRAGNDMTPGGKGGWGAQALKGLKGNASYDQAQAGLQHLRERTYKGIRGDGRFDRWDKGDGPEFTTLGKLGPLIGIKEPEQVMRLNNILNDLGLDSASTGSALAWAMELYQRGILTRADTGGLDLSWGNYDEIEKLLFLTARREGFGDVIADSNRAVDTGKYSARALPYRMTVKGLFQSDPHDARILKAFALGLAVATRGFDHLRNRPTLEINARVNDDPAYKAGLYGGYVSAQPNSYEAKEQAVRKCEDTFAVGDSVGMCRFDTRLFNSPSTPDPQDFARQVSLLTGITIEGASIDQVGRNITALERLLNFRIGLRARDDTVPERWFDESNTAGPFQGERIDRQEFEKLKLRFYELTGLNSEGIPKHEWHEKLAGVTTGFWVRVTVHGKMPGAPENRLVVDEPVSNVIELRDAICRRYPEAREYLSDRNLSVAVNGEMLLHDEKSAPVRSGDEVTLLTMIAGG